MNSKPGSDKYDPVAIVWQKKFLELFEKDSATEAYALFTSGGWSDKGQHLILFDGKSARYKGVGRNQKSMTLEKSLSQSEWTAIQRQVRQATDLENSIRVVLDGLNFEYVAMKKVDGKVKTIKRLFVNNPDHEELPKHHSLFAVFTDQANGTR